MSAHGTTVASHHPADPRFARPATELMRDRFSCRTYIDRPVVEDVRRDLTTFLDAQRWGPLGASARFVLTAASPDDPQALKKLGTYGFIKGATGFIVGAVRSAPHDLEDFGYLLEEAILYATGLGLGTCWLGGTFTKGSFVKRIGGLSMGESMPAVVSLGYPGEDGSRRIRERETSNRRLPAPTLFFEERLGRLMGSAHMGDLAPALEAVRWAPSASNKQPWRVVHDGLDWHFFLERTKGYGKGSALFSALRLADLQRVDMGIAMCHFDLAARDLGLAGVWKVEEPGTAASAGVEYTATWRQTTGLPEEEVK
jgi:nitroreductase